jgi:hypothetical protein
MTVPATAKEPIHLAPFIDGLFHTTGVLRVCGLAYAGSGMSVSKGGDTSSTDGVIVIIGGYDVGCTLVWKASVIVFCCNFRDARWWNENKPLH